MISNKKISQLPPYIGNNSPIGELPISILGVTYKITVEKVLPDNKLYSAATFKFIQKGFGNVDEVNEQIGDIYCGWKNGGTERWPEAIWNGGSKSNSDNFTPLVQTEI